MITDFRNRKLIQYLSPVKYGKALVLFPHGLGDLMNFYPLFEELKNLRPTWKFFLGFENRRGLHGLNRECVVVDDIRTMMKKYTMVFKLRYPEPSQKMKATFSISKPYLCNQEEIGIPNFKWKPYHLDVELENQDSKMIGVHFTGGTNHSIKNATFDRMEAIWTEIQNAGYEPFEVHMNHFNMEDMTYPVFFNRENSLRFEPPSIKKMVDVIRKCKYFIGIDSGPLYLAGSIIGFDKCIGLQRYLDIRHYLPVKIKLIDLRFYRHGNTLKQIEQLEKGK